MNNKYLDRYNRLWYVDKAERHNTNDKSDYFTIWQKSKFGLVVVKEVIPNSTATKNRSYAQKVLDNFAELQGWRLVNDL